MQYYSPGRMGFYRYQVPVLPVASGILRTDRNCQWMAFPKDGRSAMASERRKGVVTRILEIHMGDPCRRKNWVLRHESNAVAVEMMTCFGILPSEEAVRRILVAGRTDSTAVYHYSLESILPRKPKDLAGVENHRCGLSGRAQNSHLEHLIQPDVNGHLAQS